MDRSVLPELLNQIPKDEEVGTMTAEIPIRIALTHRFNALGAAEIARVHLTSRGNEKPNFAHEVCNNAPPDHRHPKATSQ